MKKLTVSALALLSGLSVVVGAAPAQAASHPILTSVVASEVVSAKCDEAAVKTTVKLRKGHIASDLSVDVYIGKAWKGSRTADVDIDGKTKVSFITCLPYRLLFSPKTGNAYNTKIMVTTMPRSRDSRTVTVKQRVDC